MKQVSSTNPCGIVLRRGISDESERLHLHDFSIYILVQVEAEFFMFDSESDA